MSVWDGWGQGSGVSKVAARRVAGLCPLSRPVQSWPMCQKLRVNSLTELS